VLSACGTGQTGADDSASNVGPPRTLEEAAERYRTAVFKVSFQDVNSTELAITLARSASGQSRFDLHGDEEGALTFIVDGQSIVGCIPEATGVECYTSLPEGEGTFWAGLISAMFMLLFDPEVLARGEQTGMVEVTGTREEMILGRATTCFELLLLVSEDDDAPTEALSCFAADGTPLRIGLPVDDDISAITAVQIEQPTEADFVPPAPVSD
jgi:hypothetical protein